MLAPPSVIMTAIVRWIALIFDKNLLCSFLSINKDCFKYHSAPYDSDKWYISFVLKEISIRSMALKTSNRKCRSKL